MGVKTVYASFLLTTCLMQAKAQLIDTTGRDTAFYPGVDLNRPKGYIGIYGGGALPTKSFKSTGGADNGPNIGISIGFPAKDSAKKKIYGMAFKADYCSFNYRGGPPNVQGAGSYATWPTSPYKAYDAMAGLFITIPLQQISLDARILGGVMYSKSGSYKYATLDTTGNVTNYYEQSSVTATSFIYDIGLGFRYSQKIGGWREWEIMFYADRVQSNPLYRVIQTTPYGQNPVTFAPNFQYIAITFGVGMQF